MPRYRKIPVEIDAFVYGYEPRPDWFQDEVSKNNIVTADTHCFIKTLEGQMTAQAGDYIIRGVKGEIYPCKPDIFKMTYVPVVPSSVQSNESKS